MERKERFGFVGLVGGHVVNWRRGYCEDVLKKKSEGYFVDVAIGRPTEVRNRRKCGGAFNPAGGLSDK